MFQNNHGRAVRLPAAGPQAGNASGAPAMPGILTATRVHRHAATPEPFALTPMMAAAARAPTPPSWFPYQQPRPYALSWRWALRPLVLGLMLGALMLTAYTQAGGDARARAPLTDRFDDLAVLAGFGINQVSLSGHRITADRDVFDALRLDELRSMARFSIADARERIEALPWVARASIARVLPDQLRVAIEERLPFALWRSGRADYRLIDATGHVLGAVRADAAPYLPLVIGEGAPALVQEFMTIVAAYPKIAGSVSAYERVGNRRWTLQLSSGPHRPMSILLPEENPGRSLSLLARLDSRNQILDRDLEVIDLRHPDRVSLRPARSDAKAGQRPRGPAKTGAVDF